MRRLSLLLFATACGRYGFDLDHRVDASGITPPSCTFGPWGTPTNLGSSINSASDDWSPLLSDDGLELIFERGTGDGSDADLFRAVRATPAEPFGAATAISEVNTPPYEGNPSMSADRRTLYFSSNRTGQMRLYRATRTDVNGTFEAPVLVPGLSTVTATGAAISASGDELFYNDIGWSRISRAVWNGSTFVVDGVVNELGTSASAFPDLSRDGLTIYFDLNTSQIVSATRIAPGGSFSAPTAVPNIDSEAGDCDAELGDGDRQIVFSSNRSGGEGGWDIWTATRACE